MTQEEKELLVKDLCARLPYGVKIQRDWIAPMTSCPENKIDDFSTFDIDALISLRDADIAYVICDDGKYHEIRNYSCKPYLRPMSSMTDEEEGRYNLYQAMAHTISEEHWTANDGNVWKYSDAIDYLNAHHFDYRGLIEKGLALEAPEGMYNY